jgi:hypothetical protein
VYLCLILAVTSRCWSPARSVRRATCKWYLHSRRSRTGRRQTLKRKLKFLFARCECFPKRSERSTNGCAFHSSKTVHCVEWARDRFEKLFSKQPSLLSRLLADPSVLDEDPAGLGVAVRLLSKRPATFDDCVVFARRKFQKVWGYAEGDSCSPPPSTFSTIASSSCTFIPLTLSQR